MISVGTEKPLAAWTGKDRFQGELLPSLTVIFRSGGCAWRQCLMCSYCNERYPAMDKGELAGRIVSQFAWVRAHYTLEDYPMVKLYTSGSFFDPDEVPDEARTVLADALKGKIVIAETRPEFIETERIAEFIAGLDDGTKDIPLYAAVGLETTNDFIREKSIRKGFSFSDFIDASSKARKGGAGVKAYLLAKPLFLTEKEALDDMISSVSEVAPYADIVSMNPCTVQNGTVLEWYWRRGAYRPAYLWSILTILAQAKVHVTCDPVGGGKERGPHNCGMCDENLVQGIRDFSFSGDRTLLEALLEEPCGCKEEWKFVLDREKPYCMPLTR